MKNTVTKNFGLKIKKYRRAKNFTQEKLAELININLRHLARIESGESFVKSMTLEKLSKVLDVKISSLFNFEN